MIDPRIEIPKFQAWLLAEGTACSTAGAYGSAVRVALRELGENVTTEFLDGYAAGLPTSRRGSFRAAWRAFVRWAASEGRTLSPVSEGKVGAPPKLKAWLATPLDFAIAYLARAIPEGRLSNVLLDGRGLRWTDVEFLSSADAVIHDRYDRRIYRCARTPLDVILAWARPDGEPKGAIVPPEPGSGTWMDSNVLHERIERARELAKSGAFTDPECARLWAFPGPFAEADR